MDRPRRDALDETDGHDPEESVAPRPAPPRPDRVDPDVLSLASRLVGEFGEDAMRISRVRLVELIAANDLRAAAFWRDVLRSAESLLAAADGRRRDRGSDTRSATGTGAPVH